MSLTSLDILILSDLISLNSPTLFRYRKRRDEVRTAFKALLQKKGKVHTLNYGKTWMELKEQSDVVSFFVCPRYTRTYLPNGLFLCR